MSALTGPTWLLEDVVRVEGVLEETAGASAHPLVAEAALHLMKAGGKRLRPALVVLTSRVGESGRRSTDLAAAAVELVHLATLYHDDVIDETETRRGVPAVHTKWGTEVAVLAGDYLFACGCALGAEAGGDVPSILARAIARVCEGQIVETASLGDPARPVEDYLETIRLKTAALFAASAELGVVTSGGDQSRRAVAVRYGDALGLEFQIVDDLLDLLGDPEITGKERGTDLKEGVFTAPVLIAAARDGELLRLLESGERDVDVLLPRIEAAGGIDAARRLAEDQAAEARAAAGELGDGEWAGHLVTITEGVLAQI